MEAASPGRSPAAPHARRYGKFLRAGQLQRDLDPRVLETAWKAQLRLSRRYRQLSSKSKPAGKVVTAVACELVGFIWTIGMAAETQHLRKTRKAA